VEEAQSLRISHRELEALALVIEGYKNKEIAQILKINHNQSVKNHLQHFFKKLNIKNNTLKHKPVLFSWVYSLRVFNGIFCPIFLLTLR
jgi:DNA-binding CsgD family transcriptional regulator